MNFTRRQLLGVTLIAATGAVRAQSGIAELPRRQELEIAAGAAPQTLREFIRLTGLQVLFEFDAVRHHTTHAVRGRFDPSEALARMLAGSGLAFEFVNEKTISVRPTAVLKTSEAPQALR